MSEKLHEGWHAMADGTIWPTDELVRRELPAADFWPPDPKKGDLAQREDGTLWTWTGEHWWNPRRGYHCLWSKVSHV